jgi:hypothetical protein
MKNKPSGCSDTTGRSVGGEAQMAKVGRDGATRHATTVNLLNVGRGTGG